MRAAGTSEPINQPARNHAYGSNDICMCRVSPVALVLAEERDEEKRDDKVQQEVPERALLVSRLPAPLQVERK